MQSGYARQYAIDQAFTVFLGGYLVAELHFSIPEAKQIVQELDPWINRTKQLLLEKQLKRPLEDTQVYIFKQLSSSSEGAAFAYLEKKCLSDEPYDNGGPYARQEVYREKPIPVAAPISGLYKTDNLDKMDSRILYISRLYNRFMSKMTGNKIVFKTIGEQGYIAPVKHAKYLAVFQFLQVVWGLYWRAFSGKWMPCCINWMDRISIAAPIRRFLAITAVLRLSGFSRNVPFTQALNAPMEGPHHI